MPLEVVKRVKKKILYIVYSRIKYRTHLYKYSVFSKTVVYLTQADLLTLGPDREPVHAVYRKRRQFLSIEGIQKCANHT